MSDKRRGRRAIDLFWRWRFFLGRWKCHKKHEYICILWSFKRANDSMGGQTLQQQIFIQRVTEIKKSKQLRSLMQREIDCSIVIREVIHTAELFHFLSDQLHFLTNCEKFQLQALQVVGPKVITNEKCCVSGFQALSNSVTLHPQYGLRIFPLVPSMTDCNSKQN